MERFDLIKMKKKNEIKIFFAQQVTKTKKNETRANREK